MTGHFLYNDRVNNVLCQFHVISLFCELLSDASVHGKVGYSRCYDQFVCWICLCLMAHWHQQPGSFRVFHNWSGETNTIVRETVPAYRYQQKSRKVEKKTKLCLRPLKSQIYFNTVTYHFAAHLFYEINCLYRYHFSLAIIMFVAIHFCDYLEFRIS